jgi:hypothetical protein
MGRILRTAYSCGRNGRLPVQILAGLACFSLAALAAEPIRRSFDTGENSVLLLRTHVGTIAVMGWDQNQLEIQARPASDAIEVMIFGEGQKVTVQSNLKQEELSTEDARVDFEIHVPRRSTVLLNTQQGEIKVENIEGDVTVEGVSASVVLSDVHGNISIRTVDGPIQLTASDGHIKVDSIQGDLRFTRVNGSKLVANTNSGTIRYEGDFGQGGTYVLNNYSAPIEIFASVQASFDFTARAVAGLIESNLTLHPIPIGNAFRSIPANRFLRGRVNSGQSTVEVTSYSGTIRVQGSR